VLPWETVDRTNAPDGTELVLARRGDEWAIRAGGHVLMTSRAHASEDALAEVGLAGARGDARVLVGGLGLGYTLRATLDRLGPDAHVEVAELVRAVVDWNRGPVASLAGRPLDDGRVHVFVGDVQAALAGRARFDAILLDVDNSPSALVYEGNAGLYGRAGVAACAAALRAGGRLVVWSAGDDERYLARLGDAGLAASARRVPAHGQGGKRHVVIVGEKRAAPRRGRPARP
jgi:spermidine synthase